MSARRKKKKTTSRRILRNKRKYANKKNRSYLKYLFIALLLVVGVIYLTINVRFWSKGDKFTIVSTQDSNINVVVYDPEVEKITTVLIPGDTLVDVPRNLGSMRIKNVWQLGENEGMDGMLLAETVTKNFRIPVVVWAASGANSFATGNYFEILGALFTPYKTNMSLADKFHLAIFSLGVRDFKKETIDIKQSQLLKEEQLPDGNIGYVVTNRIPKSIAILASDNIFAKDGWRVAIYDGTGKAGYAEEIGMIIEAMGGKVVSINSTDYTGDCVVVSNNNDVGKRISMLFSCVNEGGDRLSENYEVELTIGPEFYSRY